MVTLMRVMYEIPKNFQKLLNSVEVRVFIMLSLSLQIALIFLGSMRKRTASRLVNILLWTAYLSADSVATYALGVLSNSQGDEECKGGGGKSHISSYSGSSSSSSSSGKSDPNDQLLAFWAPFLLLHLGGPDTITSFALEDNALWLRHGLSLVFQVLLAIYIFIRSVPFTRLWLPSALMFVAGILKYGERTVALYYASMEGLKNSLVTEPDAGPDYAKLMEEYASKLHANLPARIEIEQEPEVSVHVEGNPDSKSDSQDQNVTNPSKEGDVQLELLENAYKFFNTFKRLIVDLILTFHDRNESQSFFIKLDTKNAFQVIEIELNFVYDTIYTKASVAHTHQGRILRLVCTGCIASAFVLFFMASKTGFHRMDIAITYVLLYGAIALDFAALVLLFTSDWTFVTLKGSKIWSWRTFVTPKVCKIWSCSAIQKRLSRIGCKCFPPFKFIEEYLSKINKFMGDIKNLFTARWSNSMGQYNLITFCIRDQQSSKLFFFKKILEFCNLKQLYDGLRYTNYEPVSDDLKELIFTELKDKVTSAEDSKGYKRFCSFRGEWALERRGYRRELGWGVQVEFDESLLLWHIATDLCYIKDKYKREEPSKPNADNRDHDTKQRIKDEHKREETSETNPDNRDHDTKQRIKLLRCFSSIGKALVSLIIKLLRCFSSIGKGLISLFSPKSKPQIKDDRREMAKEISEYLLYILVCQPSMLSSSAVIGEIRYGDTCAEAKRFFKRGETAKDDWSVCRKMWGVRTDVKPIEVKGDRSKSVLWDACILAKSLFELGDKKWEIISEVWVEMLSYAATQCAGNFHARRLSAGGELLTFVWFLMAHLGLGAQYRVESGHARAKLIVEK